MNAWLNWSTTGLHWLIYPGAALILLGLTVFTAVRYYREPPDQAAQFERELDREQGPPLYLPGPALARIDALMGLPANRVGEHHVEYPGQPSPDPRLRPDWLEDQLDRGRRRHARQMYLQGRWRAQMLAEIAGYAT
jgi:hypothetical protein